jgi:hypothetical protein
MPDSSLLEIRNLQELKDFFNESTEDELEEVSCEYRNFLGSTPPRFMRFLNKLARYIHNSNYFLYDEGKGCSYFHIRNKRFFIKKTINRGSYGEESAYLIETDNFKFVIEGMVNSWGNRFPECTTMDNLHSYQEI